MPKLEKVIAAFLQAGAGVLFIAAGALTPQDDVFLVLLGLPAIASGIGGLLLWGRAQKEGAPPAPLPPATEDINAKLRQTHELLASLQDEVGRLQEDKRFFQELYSGKMIDASAKAARDE